MLDNLLQALRRGRSITEKRAMESSKQIRIAYLISQYPVPTAW